LIARALQALIPDGAVLLAGSRGADLHDDAASDVDLVAVVPGDDRAGALQRLADALESCKVGPVALLRGAYTPVVKLLWNGAVNVDIIVAAIPPRAGTAPFCRDEWIALWARRQQLPEHQLPPTTICDAASQRAINSLRVCALLGRQPEHVKRVMREARAWARARGLYGTSLGFWGGVAWSLFVLYTRAASLRETLSLLLTHPWPTPLSDKEDDGDDDDGAPAQTTEPTAALFLQNSHCNPTLQDEDAPVVLSHFSNAISSASAVDQLSSSDSTRGLFGPFGPQNSHSNTTNICTILTPAQPRMNATHTCNVITLREMQLQAEDALAGDELRAPIDLVSCAHAVHILCEAPAQREFVMSRARRLLLALERPDVFVRPCARFSERGLMVWRLQPLPGAWTEALRLELEACARDWSARTGGVALVSIV